MGKIERNGVVYIPMKKKKCLGMKTPIDPDWEFEELFPESYYEEQAESPTYSELLVRRWEDYNHYRKNVLLAEEDSVAEVPVTTQEVVETPKTDVYDTLIAIGLIN